MNCFVKLANPTQYTVSKCHTTTLVENFRKDPTAMVS